MAFALVVALGLAGCGEDDVTPPDEDAGADTGDDDDDDADPTAADGDETHGNSDTGGSDDAGSDDAGSDDGEGSTGVFQECGNGIVEGDEECDGDEDCRADCLVACGIASETVLVDPPPGIWRVSAIASDREGGYVLGGWTTNETFEEFDALLLRVSGEGELTDWMIMEGEDNARINSIAVEEDGDLVVVGQVGQINETPLIARIDPEGETEFQTPPFGIGSVLGVALDADGQMVLAGSQFEDNSWSLWLGREAEDQLLPQYWVDEDSFSTFGGPVALGADGTAVVTAQRASPEGGPGVQDPAVVAFGPKGDPLWTYSEFLGASNQWLISVGAAVDSTGRSYAVWWDSHGSSNSLHYIVMAFEPDGEHAWTLDSADLEEVEGGLDVHSMFVDEKDRLIVVSSRVAGPEATVGDVHVLGLEADASIACHKTAKNLESFSSAATYDATTGEIMALGRIGGDDPGATLIRLHGID